MNHGDIWAIGDLQGCCTPFTQLMAHPELADDPHARFWYAGDLVNRGPESLATLQRVIRLGERAVTVLGNHDLHLLATAAGVRKLSKSDTLEEILLAPDAADLIDWLRHRPLAHYEQGHLLVHAGTLASWDVAKTLSLAAEVQQALRGPQWRKALQKIYGNTPTSWNDDLKGGKRLRVIINALTRMRLCTPAGHMDFTTKVAPDACSPSLIPWFDVPKRATAGVTVIFGHWSTLGLLLRENVVCLDTGCVWGGLLTAMRLRDRKLIQVSCSPLSHPLPTDNK
jgi:bis(5'-nucleosyl)-tetraphosphatase (symmetrical)